MCILFIVNRTKISPDRRIVYLSGAVRPEALGERFDLGVLLTPNMGNRPSLKGALWAADNGLYAGPDKPARPFGEVEFARFKALLERAGPDIDGCLFAVVPDAPRDAAGTSARWLEWAPRFRAELPAGTPLAFVGQDGHRISDIPWDELDALFIGGSDEWKLGPAELLVAEARRRGKWVHLGRVNSAKRLRLAFRFRADSADGTYIAFGPSLNTPKVQGWLSELNGSPTPIYTRGNLAWTRVPQGGSRLHVVAAHTLFGAGLVGSWYACPWTPGNRFVNRGERRCIACAGGLLLERDVDHNGALVRNPCPCELHTPLARPLVSLLGAGGKRLREAAARRPAA